ncbi:MAG: hypothetical protein HY648_03330 [Acidobacteria bacterium]|nr:hypothetical protein [Acidobacteriota bacterium]
MMLNLSEQEGELLRTLLERFIGETRSEIHHTDTGTYKDDLKTEERIAKDLLAKLSGKQIAA